MALPTDGPLSLGNIQTEFGGSNPIALSEYYRGGGLVPNITANNSIPTSGTIEVSDFYGTGVGNLLSVTTTSFGFPPIFFAFVSNQSTSIQTFTFTWKYVGQVSDIDATVSYDGTTRSPGYTTPTLSQTFGDEDTLIFEVPFSLSGGNAAEVEFEFTLITASVDTVPTAPDNKTTVYVDHNF
jgi:hypothetical protein